MNYDWDAVSLLSASSWVEMKRFSDQDIAFLAEASGLPPLPWGLHDSSEGELFTQEVRVQSRGDQPLQWTVGAYFQNSEASFAQFVPDYSCPTCLGQVARGQDFELDAPLAKFYESEQKSVFAQVSYDFAEQWTVGVGGRYLEDDITDFDISADGFLVRGFEPGPTTPEPPQTGSVDEFNPSAYVRFEPSDTTTFYAQAAKGFRSGVVNPLIADSCLEEAERLGAQEFTDPDTLWNYELGAKTQVADGRLAINGAVYRQKWEGVQLRRYARVRVLAGAERGRRNQRRRRDRGSRAARSMRGGSTCRWPSTTREFDNVVPQSGFQPGERLPEVPRINGSAGVQYNFELRQHLDGVLARGLRACRRSAPEVPDADGRRSVPRRPRARRTLSTPSTRACRSSAARSGSTCSATISPTSAAS